MKILHCIYVCKLKAVCVYLFSLLPGIGSLKKEMVKAPGFEPRIFQLLVRNLTALANSFEKYSHIKFNLKLERWSHIAKMVDFQVMFKLARQ